MCPGQQVCELCILSGHKTQSVIITHYRDMIKHLVLFKLADEAEGKTKAENALLIKERLEALKDIIPVIGKIEVWVNHADAASDNYDVVLDSEFHSLEDLETYAVHPEHLKVGAFIAKVRTDRAAIDYQL